MLPCTVQMPLSAFLDSPTLRPGDGARLDLPLALCLGQGGHAREPWEPVEAQDCLHEVHEVSETQIG